MVLAATLGFAVCWFALSFLGFNPLVPRVVVSMMYAQLSLLQGDVSDAGLRCMITGCLAHVACGWCWEQLGAALVEEGLRRQRMERNHDAALEAPAQEDNDQRQKRKKRVSKPPRDSATKEMATGTVHGEVVQLGSSTITRKATGGVSLTGEMSEEAIREFCAASGWLDESEVSVGAAAAHATEHARPVPPTGASSTKHPLLLAVESGDPAQVEAVLAAGKVGVNEFVQPLTRSPALNMAVGHPSVLHVLLDHGANINATRADGSTALCDAAMGGHVEAVEILCTRGADINMPDDDGDNPLYYAEDERNSARHAECAHILRRHGGRVITGSGMLHIQHGPNATLPPGFRSERHRRCHHCNSLPAAGSYLKKCSRCEVAQYCSKECQAKAWKAHKSVCRAAQ